MDGEIQELGEEDDEEQPDGSLQKKGDSGRRKAVQTLDEAVEACQGYRKGLHSSEDVFLETQEQGCQRSSGSLAEDW